MRIWPQCIPCIYAARARELLSSQLPNDELVYYLAALAKHLSVSNPFSSTIRLATETYRFVKRAMHNVDPYLNYKIESNKWVVNNLIPLLEKRIRSLSNYERFKEILTATIAANAIDPGVPGYENLRIDLSVELGRDESLKAYKLISRARKVAYILDNAGEAVIDLEVVKLLSSMGIEVYVMAKTFPYQNDITVNETLALGFDKFARVVGTGSDAAGPIPGELSNEALTVLNNVDVIIAKGMAVFESFEEWQPPTTVVHALRAKCLPVASSVDVQVNEGVIAIRDTRTTK
ncbi:MAG: ARMT1-like domain-containing protein [Thermofilaceae archaeon]|nr:ARMT1-like domain-containing protein [Thermofilaceae archaeon]MDW8003776.1 ARMT1-like domain-containing protein [Thermofilaceae archaeon]